MFGRKGLEIKTEGNSIAKSKVPSKQPKPLKKQNLRLRRKKSQPVQIVIDRQAGLIFSSEAELYEHFNPQIKYLEDEFDSYEKQFSSMDEKESVVEEELDQTLDEPAEIWYDDKTFKEFPIFHFIRPVEKFEAFHVAITYVSSDDEPTFIFLHFLTQDIGLVDKYRRGDLVYDRTFEDVAFGALEGDSLSEGDPLSMGLFISMLKVRSESDIPHDKFQEYGAELREDTIESADEIWRTSDAHGNNLVTFIKEYPDHETKNLYYVAITHEDPNSAVHSLLFSFPTTDPNLVERYQHGENLQAEEVTQESSH